jgi:hypothetical protein
MPRFRFSVRNLLWAVLVLGLSLAVLQWNSAILASVAFTIFLGLLALGLTGAFCRRGAARAFWIGFTIFGWLYAETAFPLAGDNASPSTWVLGFLSRPYMSSQQPTSPVILTELLFDFASVNSPLRKGAKVMAQWRSGGYYEATISEIRGGQYLATWTDGSAPSWVTRNQIEVTSAAGRQAAHSVMAIFFALAGGGVAQAFFWREPREEESPAAPRQI